VKHVGGIEQEKTINSKTRVQKHGEVFTPAWMVERMLDSDGIRQACENLTATFLEPGPGEGAFLCEVLRRKLKMVGEEYSDTLGQYENFALLALSTLYGIELLEDNTQICAINMYEVFRNNYESMTCSFGRGQKRSVQDSAKTIIAKNVVQGNFLTQQNPKGEPIVLTEWQSLTKPTKVTKTIKVIRTEYTLDDVVSGRKNELGTTWQSVPKTIQSELFDVYKFTEKNASVNMRYVTSRIVSVYKEEMEHYA